MYYENKEECEEEVRRLIKEGWKYAQTVETIDVIPDSFEKDEEGTYWVTWKVTGKVKYYIEK